MIRFKVIESDTASLGNVDLNTAERVVAAIRQAKTPKPKERRKNNG